MLSVKLSLTILFLRFEITIRKYRISLFNQHFGTAYLSTIQYDVKFYETKYFNYIFNFQKFLIFYQLGLVNK